MTQSISDILAILDQIHSFYLIDPQIIGLIQNDLHLIKMIVFLQVIVHKWYTMVFKYQFFPQMFQGFSEQIHYNIFKEKMNFKASNYFSIHQGNNSTAIQKSLLKRNVWTCLPPQKDYLYASFHWQQLNYSPKIYEQFSQLCRMNPNKCVNFFFEFQYLLNHFQNNSVVTTKSGLIKTLKYFYTHQGAALSKHIFDAIPTSFIIHANKETTQFKDFKKKFDQIENKKFMKQKIGEKHCQKNIWFIKPESDNQGKGIILSNNFKQIQNFLISKPVNSGWIVQKAIQKPFLYDNRKFDIRIWVLVTPNFQIYYYNSPYLRTSSTEYNLDNFSSQIHLTNNCQQKHFEKYSKFEDGNTLPFSRLRQYLLQRPEYMDSADLIVDKIMAKMKQMIIDTMMCAKKHFQKGGRKNQFQLFGYDFLVDQDFKTWILQINNNPYLGVPNKFIKGMLPLMIDQMLQIIVDPNFPPQNYTPVTIKRFQLLSKQRSNFRIGTFLSSRNITTNSIELKNNKAFGNIANQFSKIEVYSQQKPYTTSARTSFYQNQICPSQSLNNRDKEKNKYSTPTQTLKYLLQHYCYVDLDPFITPVNLIMSAERLLDQSCLDSNLKTLDMIVQTRVASIFIQQKFFKINEKILLAKQYPEKIKSKIIKGYENAAKNFKGKLFVLQRLIPAITTLLNRDIEQISDHLISHVMRLQIKVGGYIQKVFIPGVTTQNQKLRKIFIRSGCFSLLLFLNRTYPHLCQDQLKLFMMNLSKSDWDMFYDQVKSNGKRAYSPKSISILMKDQDSSFNINLKSIKMYSQQKQQLQNCEPMSLSKRKEHKAFRSRRHSAFPLLKK